MEWDVYRLRDLCENTGMALMVEVILSIFIMAAMVLGVLVVGSGLLHSVRSAPDGSEVDDYQSELARLRLETNSREVLDFCGSQSKH